MKSHLKKIILCALIMPNFVMANWFSDLFKNNSSTIKSQEVYAMKRDQINQSIKLRKKNTYADEKLARKSIAPRLINFPLNAEKAFNQCVKDAEKCPEYVSQLKAQTDEILETIQARGFGIGKTREKINEDEKNLQQECAEYEKEMNARNIDPDALYRGPILSVINPTTKPQAPVAQAPIGFFGTMASWFRFTPAQPKPAEPSYFTPLREWWTKTVPEKAKSPIISGATIAAGLTSLFAIRKGIRGFRNFRILRLSQKTEDLKIKQKGMW